MGNATGCCVDRDKGPAAELSDLLVSIDWATDNADSLIEKLFVEAHSDKSKSAQAVAGEDYKRFMGAVFAYVMADYEKRKNVKASDIVQTAVRQVITQTLDPTGEQAITLDTLKLSLKKVLDGNGAKKA
mmetsp:Transcript_102089/g.288314  ORF Transcript_102089/g.288314 Transcript_102089/m.288314 type:complete len:129 (-) Transcript_102089:130-516(-)